MNTWVIHGPEGPRAAPLHDPNQRIRTKLDGAEVDWHDDDGQVMSFDGVAGALEVDGHRFASLRADGVSVHATDRRVIFVLADLDPACVPGGTSAEGALRLACQVDFLCLSELSYGPADGEPGRDLLTLAVRTGEGDAVEQLALIADTEEVDFMVQAVHARTRSAQYRGSVRPLTPEGLQSLLEATLRAGAGRKTASFGVSSVSLAELAALTTRQPA